MPPRKTSTGQLSISPLQTEDDAFTCARLMTASEPWITLGRSYEASLGIIQDPSREVYLARDQTGLTGFLILCMTGALVGYHVRVLVQPERPAVVRTARLQGRRRAHGLHRPRAFGVSAAQDAGAADRVQLEKSRPEGPAGQRMTGAAGGEHLGMAHHPT